MGTPSGGNMARRSRVNGPPKKIRASAPVTPGSGDERTGSPPADAWARRRPCDGDGPPTTRSRELRELSRPCPLPLPRGEPGRGERDAGECAEGEPALR